jgi:hypothetical protein
MICASEQIFIHHHLMSRLRMRASILPLPLRTFVTFMGTTWQNIVRMSNWRTMSWVEHRNMWRRREMHIMEKREEKKSLGISRRKWRNNICRDLVGRIFSGMINLRALVYVLYLLNAKKFQTPVFRIFKVNATVLSIWKQRHKKSQEIHTFL